MTHRIELPDSTYQRLEGLAEGFDTPASVIERLLDHYEQAPAAPAQPALSRNDMPSKVDIEVLPDPDTFKRQLLEQKRAWVLLQYLDGTSRIHEWRTHRFSESSDVIMNLRSGYLRGWREKGIVSAKVSVHREDLDT